MPTTATNPMSPLYGRLAEYGFSRPFVQKVVLPDWWDDEAASSPAGMAEAMMLISRHLGLDIRTLKGEGEIRASHPLSVKLKRPANVNAEDLDLSERISAQVARLVAHGMPSPALALPVRGGEIRERILERAPRVGLEDLLAFCWSVGVPVVHVSSFPPGCAKPHGLALRVDGRPVIVVAWNRTHPAWLLFVVAHELGHLCLGHVADGTLLVDQKISQVTDDNEERAANAFALELLCGHSGMRFSAPGRWPKAESLAEQAQELGKRHRVDPGHVVLNYADSMGDSFWPVANAALKLLPAPNALDTIRQFLARNLDWNRLDGEAAAFVSRATQTPVDVE
jgi:Zn-dependent peptidase ImmA (M78 family)